MRVVSTVAVLVLLAAVPAAGAQTPVLVTGGSTLQTPANLVLPGGANQCLARPYIGLSAGDITFLNTGASTCMWWSTQYGPDGSIVTARNTYIPRGAGAVTRVRVRSGEAPAPLQFAIVSSGGGFCCTEKTTSPVVQPTANTTTEFSVNLPSGSGVGDVSGSQFNDILVVVAVGPGSLPVNDRGTHGFLFSGSANQAQANFLHPALTGGNSNTDVGLMDGYEVLMQYDWCGMAMTGSNLRPVAPADPQIACGPSPLQAAAAVAVVRGGNAALRLRCALDRVCSGLVTLIARGARTAATGRATSYGSARFNLAAGKAGSVKVRLSAAGRKALARKGRLPVDAVVTAGGGTWKLKLTLKR